MLYPADIAAIGAMLGDPTRAAMVAALLDGRALTVRELALRADVTPQTASFHLAKLANAKLVRVVAEGRHHYYGIAGSAIREGVEALAGIASATRGGRPRPAPARPPDASRFARRCYDHLAGRLAVALTAALQTRGLLEPAGRDFRLSPRGGRFFANLGIDFTGLRRGPRHFARACLDWSERRPHLAGALGAALLDQLITRRWLSRRRGARTVYVTPAGRRELRSRFGVDVEDVAREPR
jgi:DNA-binding transcriptional ArsR family regulator